MQIWLKFEDESDEEPTYTANLFVRHSDVLVEWMHEDVGEVRSRSFTREEDATEWLTSQGFSDYTA